MSKMRTKNTKGRRGILVVLLSLLMAVSIGGAGLFTAAAWGEEFYIDVCGEHYTFDWWNQWDGGNNYGQPLEKSMEVSTEQTLNLFTDKVFEAYNLSGIKALKIVGDGITNSSNVRVEIDKSLAEDEQWSGRCDGDGFVYTYVSNKNIGRSDFNSLMAKLRVKFAGDEKVTSATGKLTIYGYSTNKANDIDKNKGVVKTPRGPYSVSFRFYRFAEGKVNDGSVKMDYKSDNDADFESTGAQGQIQVHPEDKAGGQVTFDLKFTSFGGTVDGTKRVTYGYQVKKASDSWTGVPVVIVNKESPIETSEWDINTPVQVKVPFKSELGYLEAGADYDVRGVMISDAKENYPTYTGAVRVRYDKPEIFSFTAGTKGASYQSGRTVNLNMHAAFADKNYVDGREYQDINGNTRTAPALSTKVYFTPDRNFAEQSDGTQRDMSTWYELVDRAEEKDMVTDEGTITTEYKYNKVYTLPAKLSDVDTNITPDSADDRPIDTRNASFKIVVTDLATGYSVCEYSDPITIDSTEPQNLQVTGKNSFGGSVSLDLAPIMSPVGGVTLTIGDATDDTPKAGETIRDDIGLGKGSGELEYSYSLYYLPTKVAQTDETLMSMNVAGILNSMKDYTETSYKEGVERTTWTSLSTGDNKAELALTKDGYYRVDIRVTDASGRYSEKRAYARVDLTAPNTPKVALATVDDSGNFVPYDNRTYSTHTVWLFAYSEPLTGKSMQTYQYSTDGGLSWIDLAAMTTDASGDPTTTPQVPGNLKKLPFIKTDASGNVIMDAAGAPQPQYVSVDGKVAQKTDQVQVYDYNNNFAKINFTYHAAVNLSGMGNSDYVPILVRGVDSLGNTSLVSDEIVMRTVAKTPTATGTLKHAGIEVALAMGNTTVRSSVLTPYLKNAAALKINARYYGTGSTEYAAIADHICEWEDAATCEGECKLANCPYNSSTVEYFKPSMVNVQGMSSGNASESNFDWIRFDHTSYNVMTYKDYATGQTKTTHIPTVSYVNTTNGKTNLQPDTTSTTYTAKNGEVRYTQVDKNGRVLYLAQATTATRPFTKTNKDGSTSTYNIPADDFDSDGLASYGNSLPERGASIIDKANWGSGVGSGSWYWYTNAASAGGIDYVAGKTIPAVDTYNKAGHYFTENLSNLGDHFYAYSIARRVYRMVDMSQATNPATGKKDVNGYADLSNPNGDMSTIMADNGYWGGSFRDWLFLYNEQSAKKEISFSIDDREMSCHSADFGGFLFNTTIRQNDAGNWRISGYLFMMGNAGHYDINDQRLWVIKIDDVNLDHFADGGLVKGGAPSGSGTTEGWAVRANNWAVQTGVEEDDFPLHLLDYSVFRLEPPYTGGRDPVYTFKDGGSLVTVGYSDLDSSDVQVPNGYGGVIGEEAVRHYRLITEGNFTSVYMYNSKTNSPTFEQLDEIYENSDLAVVKMPASKGTSKNGTDRATHDGFKKIQWETYYESGTTYSSNEVKLEYGTAGNDGSILYTPRPKVDGVAIGEEEAEAQKIHTDTNCYGFGPIVGSRSSCHAYGCLRGSRVLYTNINMKVYIARKLSEVVIEPQWGSGQAKYIANLSDDSVEDFHDPILSAQIRWRLNHDQAKFIGWGKAKNKTETTDFLQRIEGSGTYVISDNSSKPLVTLVNNKADLDAMNTQIDEVSTYITQEYYTSLGFDMDDSTLIKDQVKANTGKHGQVYTLDNISKIDFSVEADSNIDYNASSANPDFPSGRWYMVHDTLGYQTGKNPLSDQFTDSLNLNNISRPGRYTVYFAPPIDAVKGTDGKEPTNALNPADAVFDFVVQQSPIAQFTGKVDAEGNITIEEVSYDPDCPTVKIGGTRPNSGDVKYRINGEEKTYNACELNGINKREWKWEITTKTYYTDKNKTTISDTPTDFYSVTVKATSGDTWIEDDDPTDGAGGCPGGWTLSSLTEGTMTTMGANDIMTVYERVTDIAAQKVAYTAAGKKAEAGEAVAYYQYEQLPEDSVNVSSVCQQNLSQGSDATFAPMAAFQFSTSYMYDTAEGDTAEITVTRQSLQPQQKDINYKWSINRTGSGSNYVDLTEDTSTHDWYDGSTKILDFDETCMSDPDYALTTKGGGRWVLTKAAVQSIVGGAGNTGTLFALRLTEQVYGKSVTDIAQEQMHPGNPEYVAKDKWITDFSGRTAYYRRDDIAPTPQMVTTRTVDAATGKESEYLASGYLDVTNKDKYIKLSVSGSRDNEGSVAGYAYYFYDKDSTKVANQAGYEKQYYYLDSNYNLQKATSLADAVSKQAYKISGITGGDILVKGNIMDDLSRRPTYSANVAVYAYDTNGNQANKTRVEDIKLSTSAPVKPAITATAGQNGVLAKIDNTYGFNGGKAAPSYDVPSGVYTEGPAGTDVMTTDAELDYYGNTSVTLQFTPKEFTFAKDANGVLYPSGASQNKYYQDIYGRADLTGSPMIVYTIERKEREADSDSAYQVYELLGVRQENIEMSPALNVSLNQDGCYRVTARVKNGSGVLSDPNSISFTIDQVAPAIKGVKFYDNSGTVEVPYDGTWSQSVRAEIQGADELNLKDAKFYYSIDNGATWTRDGLSDGLGTMSFYIQKAGRHYVRVKAVDKAGNESTTSSETVQIDNEKPTIEILDVVADSSTEELYSSQILTITTSSGHGTAYAMNEDGSMNYVDNVISVPTGESARVYITPDSGYQIMQITYGDTVYKRDVTGEDEKDLADVIQTDENGKTYFLCPTMKEDMTLDVVFDSDQINTVSYMAAGRRASYSMVQASLAAYERGSAPVEEPEAAEPTSSATDAVISAASEVVSSAIGQPEETLPSAIESAQAEEAPAEAGEPKYDLPLLYAANNELGGEPAAQADGDGAEKRTYMIDARNSDGGSTVTTNPSNGSTVEEGTPIDVTVAIRNKNYDLDQLTFNGSPINRELLTCTTNPSNGLKTYTYTIPGEQVTGDASTMTIRASTKLIDRRVMKLKVVNDDLGTVSVDTSGDGIDPNEDGTYTVRVGDTIPITITPKAATNETDGNMIESIKVDGVEDTDYSGQIGECTYNFIMQAYTPESEGAQDTGSVLEITFNVAESVEEVYAITASVNEACRDMGTISPEGTLLIAATGTRQVRITPYAGYHVDQVVVSQFNGERIVETVYSEGNGGLASLIDLGGGNYAYQFKDVLDNQSSIEVFFAANTYKIENESESLDRGNVGVSSPEFPDGMDKSAVPEGTTLHFKITPRAGYKIKNVKVTTTDRDGTTNKKEVSLGSISTYTVTNLHQNVSVYATFEARVINTVETSHSITATANKVVENVALADSPYRFRIRDEKGNVSDWSAWQQSNSISYKGIVPAGSKAGTEPIPFAPNTKYIVEMEVKDRVGNISDVFGNHTFTRANTPALLEARSKDRKNDESAKDVELVVDPKGNPSDTRYRAYYCLSNDINAASIANVTAGDGGWGKLENGVFTVQGLIPGLHYYLWIEAQNNLGFNTVVNERDYKDLMLSPASPPEGSLYFIEQQSPSDGIRLEWNGEEGGEVQSVEIYRDGMYLAECPLTQGFYEDPAANVRGDSIYVYSYSYVNDAGTGSSRTAISQEFHEAYQNNKLDPNDPKYSAELAQKYALMSNLINRNSEDLFSETMTYPKFPKSENTITRIYAAQEDSQDTNSGKIVGYVALDSNTVDRWQHYKLGLLAYEKVEKQETDLEGNVTTKIDYERAPEHDGAIVDTKVTSNYGAFGTWENLNTDYVYKVYIHEISSNGYWQRDAAGVSTLDGYDGQEPGTGIEGALKKKCVVNETGFHTEFGNETVIGQLNTQSGTWADDQASLDYTLGIGWDQPLKMEFITFNRSPDVEAASPIFGGNDPEKLPSQPDGGNYLLIDQSMSDMTFKVNAVVYNTDKDQESDAKLNSLYVKGDLNGVIGKTAESQIDIPQTREEALLNPFQVIFDGRQIPTGVYTDKLLIKASDGFTERTKELKQADGMKLVINRASPTLTVADGTDNRKLQKGKTYAESVLNVTSDIPLPRAWDPEEEEKQQAALRDVRLIVMYEQYDELFGGHTLDVIDQNLRTAPNAAYVDKAKELMTAKYGDISAYISGSGLNETGVKKAIEAVAPPITGYFETTEAVWSAHKAEAPDAFMTEGTGSNTRYWVEQGTALANGWCDWMQAAPDGGYTITGEIGSEYSVQLVASFGGNTYPVELRFNVVDEPYVKINSKKEWRWEESPKDEFEVYREAGYTIANIVEKYQYCFDPATTPVKETDQTQPAYKEETDEHGKTVYKLYKLMDESAETYVNWLTGTLQVETGIYDTFSEVGVIRSRTHFDAAEYNYEVSDISELPDAAKAPVTVRTATETITKVGNGTYSYYVEPLDENTIYYLWSYYKTPEGKYHLSSSYVALTTEGDYQIAKYGWEKLQDSKKEKDASSNGLSGTMSLGYRIKRTGSPNAYGDLTITAEYFEADEFGNLLMMTDADGNQILDSDGRPIPKKITDPDQLQAARETFSFEGGAEQGSVSFMDGGNQKDVLMTLNDTDAVQGHMIVRLTLSVKEVDDPVGYNQILAGQGQIDIFIQDNESEVQSYRMQLNDANSVLGIEKDNQGQIKNYTYTFPGMQVGDPVSAPLDLVYQNIGTGRLNNITATIYTEYKGTTVSDAFTATTARPNVLQPSKDPSNPTWGTVSISPTTTAANTDKQHVGYVCLSSDMMEPEDYIWVKVTQVVGQSTLKGRIYVGAMPPTRGDEHTGSADIYLYPNNTQYLPETQSYNRDWLYHTTSSEYGGTFEIPNIINNTRYRIVVKRNGFLIYDGVRYGTIRYLQTTSNSQTFNFDLRLIGGDASGDGYSVDSDDEEIFNTYFNNTYNMETEPANSAIRRCDYNLDGAVNALDRAVLVAGMNKYSSSYTYVSPAAITTP